MGTLALVVGLILAGGKSKRFGSPKAIARVAGKTFLEHVYDAIRPVVDEVFVLVSETTPEAVIRHIESLGLAMIRDAEIPGCRGPPRAVVTAYEELTPKDAILLAVDYPFITTATLLSLLHAAKTLRADALTPMLYPGYPLVTLGYLGERALRTLAKACPLKGGHARLTDAYRGAPSSYITGWSLHTSNGKELFNVNRRTDLTANVDVAPQFRAVAIESSLYREAIHHLELGLPERASHLFMMEALSHELRGLTLFAEHALKIPRQSSR